VIEPITFIVAILVGIIALFVGTTIYESRWCWEYRVRYLDHDPEYEKTTQYPVKKWTIEHLDGDTSTVKAHLKQNDGEFAKFYMADTTTWNRLTADPHNDHAGKPWGGTRGYERIGEYDSIKEITEEQLYKQEYTVVFDRRTGNRVQTEVEKVA
jgi:hypothetical protein